MRLWLRGEKAVEHVERWEGKGEGPLWGAGREGGRKREGS